MEREKIFDTSVFILLVIVFLGIGALGILRSKLEYYRVEAGNQAGELKECREQLEACQAQETADPVLETAFVTTEQVDKVLRVPTR